MKSGKVLLIVFIVLALTIGVTTFDELGSNENKLIQIGDLSSQVKTIEIELSDGAGSSDKG